MFNKKFILKKYKLYKIKTANILIKNPVFLRGFDFKQFFCKHQQQSKLYFFQDC